MTKLTQEYVKLNNQSLLKLGFEFDVDFDFVEVLIDGQCPVSTMHGTIKKEEIVGSTIKKMDCFIEPVNDINVLLSFFKNGLNFNSETIQKKITQLKQEYAPYTPIVFTGKNGMESFKNRIKNKILSDWSATISVEKDLKISIYGKKRDILVCLGSISTEIKANDLVFTVFAENDTLYVPNEALNRFSGETIALHILTKPDFQKTIKNLFYKSKISNELYIE